MNRKTFATDKCRSEETTRGPCSFYRPEMTRAGISSTTEVEAVNEKGEQVSVHIAAELPLTILIDDQEFVTLMTLGTHPEELALGYIRNQGIIDDIKEIRSVTVDWTNETAKVTTCLSDRMLDLQQKTSKRIITSGCGQGTLFSCTLDKLYETRLPARKIRQSTIYHLLKQLSGCNKIYREAGSVHGCGLCNDNEVLLFVEDVGRHNAADVISGRMWVEQIAGEDKILYTTGRLTSEIVMKAAYMRIPVLLSRSGITHMGLELAQDLGITLITRAKNVRFLVYNGKENIIFDSPPEKGRTR